MRRKYLIALVVCCVIGPFNRIHAQAYIALDNISQPIAAENTGSTGTQIQTGTNPAGYTFNDLQLSFANALGNPDPSWLQVIFCGDNSGAPGNPFTYLNVVGNPLEAGLYTFAPTSSTTLAADTDYWIIIGVTGGNTQNDDYQVSYTSTTAAMSSDGWTITGNSEIGQNGIPIFSIDATPISAVPEPSSFALLIPAMLAVFLRKKISRLNCVAGLDCSRLYLPTLAETGLCFQP